MRRILFESLVARPLTERAPEKDDAALAALAQRVDRAAWRRLGRSLSIREVDAGSCNGCELEIHALNNASYDATPDPKWVVAVGDCAVDGGIFSGSYAVVGAVENVVPVDLHIRGCPPRPTQLLAGLLALLENM